MSPVSPAVEDPGQAVAAVWWEQLGPPRDVEDERVGFVTLGGFSLAAARTIAEIRTRLGVDLPIALLLRDNASLADVRRAVVAAVPSADHGADPAAPSSASGHPAPGARSPLAPGQQRLWLLSELSGGAAAYNVLVALRLSGRLSVEALGAALNDVAGRHDALRAETVVDADGGVSLHYRETVEVPLARSDSAQELTDDAIAAFVRAVGSEPIPTSAAPMLRGALLCSPGPDACLVLSAHHMIADQRSMDVVLRDLAVAYSARLAGSAPSFAEAPRFSGYAATEAATVESPRWQADLDYWRSALAGLSAVPALPFGLSARTASDVHRAESHDVDFGASTGLIDAMLSESGFTPAVFFIACVAVVLTAWHGTERVVVGTPTSRRRTTEDHDLVGFLVDTMPIVVEPAAAKDVTELLDQVRGRYLDAIEHNAPPFDVINQVLGLAPAAEGSSLFRCWFNDLTQGEAPPGLTGLDVAPVATTGSAALFELNLYLHRDASGYRLRLVRAAELVRADVAAEFAAQVGVVVERAVRGSGAPSTWSLRTSPVTDIPRSVGPQALEQAEFALSSPYGELDALAVADAVDALAERLVTRGVGAGTVVEVLAARAGGLLTTLLACRRIGAVAALVDAGAPAARIAECRALLRPHTTVEVLTSTANEVRLLRGVDAPRSLPGAAHVLFTSGTTGRPAAVVVPRAAFDAALGHYLHTLGTAERPHRVAVMAGPAHDPVLRDLLVPVHAGGTVIVPEQEAFNSPSALLALLARERVTLLHATPALLEYLLAGRTDATRPGLPDLRLIVCCGAALTAGLVRRLRELTAAAVVNGYGTTETPQLAACHPILRYGEDAVDALRGWPDEAALPLGRGLGSTVVLVRTSAGQDAGIGQLGEIVLRGTDFASGYLDDSAPPGRFTAQPDGTTEFRTGDLGRLGPDGATYFAGRGDRQLIVDGFRVEPAEIEAAALAIPGVRQAVAGMAAGSLSLQVVAAQDAAVSTELIRSRLRTVLPRQLVPQSIAVVAALAKNSNHKVVLAADPESVVDDHNGWDEQLAWLGDVFFESLGYRIGNDQNFFDAGLTSMTLLRLHGELAARIADPPPPTALFAHPNLRAYARLLSSGAQGGDPERVPRRRPGVDFRRIEEQAQRRRDVRRRRAGSNGSGST